MNALVVEGESGRTATIFPFNDDLRTIIVFQSHVKDTGRWNGAHIEWFSMISATADETEQFFLGLQEAVRIYRNWIGEQ